MVGLGSDMAAPSASVPTPILTSWVPSLDLALPTATGDVIPTYSLAKAVAVSTGSPYFDSLAAT